jgi:hypothetical protein
MAPGRARGERKEQQWRRRIARLMAQNSIGLILDKPLQAG